MNAPEEATLEQRRQAWSRYWQAGPLHCLAESFTGNYDGGIGSFWKEVSSSLGEGQRVLDIGTGNGALPALLEELCPETMLRIDAVDLAQPSPRWHAALPRETRDRIRFHGNVRAEVLPFADARFDLAVSQYGVEYSDHAASARELARTLKPGGRCAFVLHHAASRLHAVARDEVTAAEHLLASGGLFEHAERLLPYLAKAAAGQAGQLRADAGANEARESFNRTMQSLQESAGGLQHPQLLLDAWQWVARMNQAVLQREASPVQAAGHLEAYRQDIDQARLRSAELIAHALDEAGIDRFTATLASAGFIQVEYAPLWHQPHLVGWCLRGMKAA